MASLEAAHEPQQEAHIEVDHAADNDSSLGDDESAYTESLRSSLLVSVSENGRGYHKYRDGAYMLPEDEREQERLDMQHTMMLKLFDNKLILAPMDTPPLNAIDLGTGTGIWAIDFADAYPECQVLGIDLSPIQPAFVPPNCKFEIDDYESDWTYKQRFDLVHGRLMVTSLGDPQALFKKAYDNITPGGWFELQDLYMPILSDDGTMTKDCPFGHWCELFSEAIARLGRDTTWVTEYKSWMEQTGFVNIEQHSYKIPINTWPKDKRLKELGKWNLINMVEGLEGYTVRLFTKVLGMSIEEVELLMMEVRKNLHDKKMHSYWPMYVVYGQKPSA